MFVKAFDPKEKSHVLWLKDMCTTMAKVYEGNAGIDIVAVADGNPFGAKLESPLDLAEVHFQVAMKYTAAVLSEDAWVPGKNVDP
jgi:hypothetical protein